MISVATKRTLTSHGFYLHFFFKHVFQFMSKTFLFLVCNFPQLFQLFIFNHILWIIAVPFFLVYQKRHLLFLCLNSLFPLKAAASNLCLIVFLQHMAYTYQKYEAGSLPYFAMESVTGGLWQIFGRRFVATKRSSSDKFYMFAFCF